MTSWPGNTSWACPGLVRGRCVGREIHDDDLLNKDALVCCMLVSSHHLDGE